MFINLAVNELKAANSCAGKKEIRYYLNGVCIDFIEPHKVAIIGTDGSCMFVCNAQTDDSYTDFIGQVIIPSESVTAALKNYDKKARFIALKHIDGITYQLGNVLFNMIDGKFPDYRLVIPAKFEPSLANYDLKILTASIKAMMYYENESKTYQIAIIQNGDNGGIIKSKNEKAICIVMPLRIEQESFLNYSGFTVPLNQQEKAA